MPPPMISKTTTIPAISAASLPLPEPPVGPARWAAVAVPAVGSSGGAGDAQDGAAGVAAAAVGIHVCWVAGWASSAGSGSIGVFQDPLAGGDWAGGGRFAGGGGGS